MTTLKSIVVTVSHGGKDQTFNVDIDQDCCLFWGKGWDVLADYYRDVQHAPLKEQEVRNRTCRKARPKDGLTMKLADPETVIALKTDSCDPTQWP